MLKLLGIISANLFFSPPKGWTMIDSEHAVKDSNAFEKGELVEVSSAGKQLHHLGFALMNRGFNLETIAVDSFGHADLTLADRVGHARWSNSHKHWTVFLAAQKSYDAIELNEFFQSIERRSRKQRGASKSKWSPNSTAY